LISVATLALAVVAGRPRGTLPEFLVPSAISALVTAAVREAMPSRPRLLLAASPVRIALCRSEVAVAAILHPRRIVLSHTAAEPLPSLAAVRDLALARTLSWSRSIAAKRLC
jgi:hypothetical protein